jgi:hypothetical protein
MGSVEIDRLDGESIINMHKNDGVNLVVMHKDLKAKG